MYFQKISTPYQRGLRIKKHFLRLISSLIPRKLFENPHPWLSSPTAPFVNDFHLPIIHFGLFGVYLCPEKKAHIAVKRLKSGDML